MDRGPKGLPQFVPLDVRAKIFNEFLVQNRFSPESKDRAMCYALIVALMASRYSIEFTAWNNSLKSYKPDQLKRLANVVGAQLHADALTGQNYIVLKLPLATFTSWGPSARKKRRTM